MKTLLKISVMIICTAVFLCSCGNNEATLPQQTDEVNVATVSPTEAPTDIPLPDCFDVSDASTWYGEAPDGGLQLSKIDGIKEGMTLEEIVFMLGKPQRDIGSGF